MSRGQKPWIIPSEKDGGKDLNDKLSKIREIAKFTDTEKEIYCGLGINHDTWYRYKKIYPTEFSEALETPWVNTLHQVKSSMINRALDGDYNAQRFILERKAGWSEKQQVQVSTFNWPDAKGVELSEEDE